MCLLSFVRILKWLTDFENDCDKLRWPWKENDMKKILAAEVSFTWPWLAQNSTSASGVLLKIKVGIRHIKKLTGGHTAHTPK